MLVWVWLILVALLVFLFSLYVAGSTEFSLVTFLIVAGFDLAALAIVSRLIWKEKGIERKRTKTPLAETYLGLRRLALETPPPIQEEPNGNTGVYGVLMELGVGSGIATLTSFSSGDASLYLSSGGGMLGGIGHAQVSNAAKIFVAEAAKALSQMQVASQFPLPTTGRVRFYVLTQSRKFTAEEKDQTLAENQSVFSDLFFAGQEVITQFRLTSEQKTNS
mgnify:FL=1